MFFIVFEGLSFDEKIKNNKKQQTQALNCQSLFRCNDFVKNEVFNTFYEDYVEFEHYVNDIVKLVTPITSLLDENNFKKMKIKSLEEEIKLKKENIALRENILTQLKIIKNLSGNNEEV